MSCITHNELRDGPAIELVKHGLHAPAIWWRCECGFHTGETCDVFAIIRTGESVVVEVKTSHTDSLADEDKRWRQEPKHGVGQLRIMLSPKGVEVAVPVSWIHAVYDPQTGQCSLDTGGPTDHRKLKFRQYNDAAEKLMLTKQLWQQQSGGPKRQRKTDGVIPKSKRPEVLGFIQFAPRCRAVDIKKACRLDGSPIKIAAEVADWEEVEVVETSPMRFEAKE